MGGPWFLVTVATYGLREWTGQLHEGRHSELVATFDTRVSKVRHLPGAAPKKAAKIEVGRCRRLVRHWVGQYRNDGGEYRNDHGDPTPWLVAP
jgi:hypothetical protein